MPLLPAESSQGRLNVDLVLMASLTLVGVAGVLLALILLACKPKRVTAAGVGLDQSASARDARNDSAIGDSLRTGRDAAEGGSKAVSTAQQQHPAAGSTHDSPLSGLPCCGSVQTHTGRRSFEGSLVRRPLARSQRHDSSSTLEQASSMASSAGFGAAGTFSLKGMLGDTAYVPGSTVSHRSSSSSTQQRPSAEYGTLRYREGDLQPIMDQEHTQQPQQQQQQQQQHTSSEQQPVLHQGQLLVPTWVMPPPSPLQAVSAPLAGLITASSSNSQEQLPGVQSFSEPSGSIISPPHRPAAPQSQLPASIVLQEATLASKYALQPHAAPAVKGHDSSSSSSNSAAPAARAAVAPAAAAAAAAQSPESAECASERACTAPTQATHSADSAQPAALDLAALTLSGTGRSAAGSTTAHGTQPPTDAAAAAARSAAGTAFTPAVISTLAATSSSAAAARGGDGPVAGTAAAAAVPPVSPIGLCLPAGPWPASVPSAAAAPGGPQPTALYRSPLHHVTISVKVRPASCNVCLQHCQTHAQPVFRKLPYCLVSGCNVRP